MLKLLGNSYLPLITSELQYVSSKDMIIQLVMGSSVSQDSFMQQLGNAICESTTQQINDCYLFRGSVQRNVTRYFRSLFSKDKSKSYECQQVYPNIWRYKNGGRVLVVNYASFRYTN